VLPTGKELFVVFVRFGDRLLDGGKEQEQRRGEPEQRNDSGDRVEGGPATAAFRRTGGTGSEQLKQRPWGARCRVDDRSKENKQQQENEANGETARRRKCERGWRMGGNPKKRPVKVAIESQRNDENGAQRSHKHTHR
jgi:hypothetical protein